MLSVITLVCGLLATAQVLAQEHGTTPTKCDVLKVANEYKAAHFPDIGNPPYKAVQRRTENSDLWEVSYELPANFIGGGPILTISKSKCEVVHAYVTQ